MRKGVKVTLTELRVMQAMKQEARKLWSCAAESIAGMLISRYTSSNPSFLSSLPLCTDSLWSKKESRIASHSCEITFSFTTGSSRAWNSLILMSRFLDKPSTATNHNWNRFGALKWYIWCPTTELFKWVLAHFFLKMHYSTCSQVKV